MVIKPGHCRPHTSQNSTLQNTKHEQHRPTQKPQRSCSAGKVQGLYKKKTAKLGTGTAPRNMSRTSYSVAVLLDTGTAPGK